MLQARAGLLVISGFVRSQARVSLRCFGRGLNLMKMALGRQNPIHGFLRWLRRNDF